MGDFKSASLWVKLALLLTATAIIIFHVAFLVSGWGQVNAICFGDNCNNTYQGTEFCMVVGYVAHLLALFLIICLILIEPLSGKKPALIAFVVSALVAGVLELVGIIIFAIEVSDDYTYSSLHTVLACLMVIVAGVFGILELVGVKSP